MRDAILTQAEADVLLATQKEAEPGNRPLFPNPGTKVEVVLRSLDKRETFLLDVSRGHIKLTKMTYQHRAKQTVILARVDIDGPPHRNPDGVEVPCFRTCTSTVKALQTSGRNRCLRRFRAAAIFGARLRTPAAFVVSSGPQHSIGDFSYESNLN